MNTNTKTKTLYVRKDRKAISREQYHKNKKLFENKTQIVKIPIVVFGNYMGYEYFASPEVFDKLI